MTRTRCMILASQAAASKAKNNGTAAAILDMLSVALTKGAGDRELRCRPPSEVKWKLRMRA